MDKSKRIKLIKAMITIARAKKDYHKIDKLKNLLKKTKKL